MQVTNFGRVFVPVSGPTFSRHPTPVRRSLAKTSTPRPPSRKNLCPPSPCRPQKQFGIRAKLRLSMERRGSDDEAKLLVFETEEDVAVNLAKYIADLSEKFVREKGSFTVVLSGGYMIQNLRKLAESPYVESVEWVNWHVFWLDERVVPKNHPDSNYKLAYDGLLSKVPVPPGQIYAINDTLSAEDAANDYEACLRRLVQTKLLDLSPNGFPKFDLILLGMGPDGHIASLFSGHPLLKEDKLWVTFIKDSPKLPPQRITFTFPVINSATNIALVVTGPGEVDAVRRALGANQGSDPLPVQMVSTENGKLTWFTDKQATAKLWDLGLK